MKKLFQYIWNDIRLFGNNPKDYVFLQLASKEPVSFQKYDHKAYRTGKTLERQIQQFCKLNDTLFMGSTALGIGGQNDIDLYVFTKPEGMRIRMFELQHLFGTPTKVRGSFIEWEFKENGFPVELVLADPDYGTFREQVEIYHILRLNTGLNREYEDLKRVLDGAPKKAYQRAKMLFFMKILA